MEHTCMRAFSALQCKVCWGAVHAAQLAVQVTHGYAATATARTQDSRSLCLPVLLTLAAVAIACATSAVAPSQPQGQATRATAGARLCECVHSPRRQTHGAQDL
jgi:hypothetical protein